MDFATLALAVPLFAVTNVDDIFVLVGFFSDRRFRPRQVVVGTSLGMAVLVGASVLAALVSLVLAPPYVGLLGLIPLALGLKKLFDLRKPIDAAQDEIPDRTGASGLGKIIAVAAVTIANGGDNLGV